MPGITEFGPIVLSYEKDEAEYVSFSQGKDILGHFVFVETQSKGKITVSAEDQNFRKSDSDPDEYDVEPFRSDNKVTLFTVSLRVKPESVGNLNIGIESTGVFKNDAGEKQDVVKGSAVSLPISINTVSKDATLAFLSLDGVSISPEFNPNITDYYSTKTYINIIAYFRTEICQTVVSNTIISV